MSDAAPRFGDKHDLRLYGIAAGAWLTAVALVPAPAGVAVTVAALAAALSVACGVLLATAGRAPVAGAPGAAGVRGVGGAVAATGAVRAAGVVGAAGVVLGVLLGVVCGAAAVAARTYPRDAPVLARLVADGAQVGAEVVVSDDPARVRGAVGPPTYLVRCRLVSLSGPAVRLDVRAIVLATDAGWRSLLPGQRVRAQGRLAAPRGGDLTAAVLRVRTAPERVGGPSWAQRAATRLRGGLQAAATPLPAEPGGLLPGLVIGDTSRLDPALEEEFRTTGLTHLVAVSGANVAIILAVVLAACRRCRAGPWTCVVVCALVLVGFVILARPSPSVLRAAAMGAVGLLALGTGRRRAAAPTLATAVFVLILVDPDLARDPGFALSSLATGGLVLLAPVWRDALRARRVPAVLAEALAVPAAAQVACGPVIAALSGTVSAVAVPANMLAVPAVAPATLLGVLAALVSPVWPGAAAFLDWLASWPARWLVEVAHQGSRVPAATLPWPDGVGGGLLLAVVTVALLVAGRWRLPRRLALVVVCAVTVGGLPVRVLASGWPPAGAIVVACDVGQGDAIVLPVGVGRAVVVDAGPDPSLVDRCLRDLRIDRVELLVLTHFHADHVDGVPGVLRGRTVAAVALPTLAEPADRVAAVRAAVRAVPTTEPAAGWQRAWPGLTLTALGPVRRLAGTNSDPNNNSLVLRADTPPARVLLTGDAEVDEQHDLAGAYGADVLRADVLKVAHHGSAYQDPALLDAVRPRVALVSVGVDNRYGHPNPGLLDRLARGGARVLRTDTGGDVAVVALGRGIGVVTHASTGRGRSSGAGAASSGDGGRSSVQRRTDHAPGAGSGPADVQGCRGDTRYPWRTPPRRRRRGVPRGAGGERGDRGGPGRRRHRSRHRTPRRRHHTGRAGQRGQPFPLRRAPRRGHPRGAGRQEGTRGRLARLRRRSRPRRDARAHPRRRRQG